MKNRIGSRLGRLGSLVVAGVITSTVVAAIALGASAGNQSSASTKVSGGASAGSLQLGTGQASPILAYSWGVSNSGSASAGSGAGAGKANVQDLSLTRAMDSTSVDLLKKVTLGTHYPSAVVIATSNASSATMKYELTDVLVTSVSLGSSGGEKLDPTENVTLNFAKVKWTYTDAAGVVTFGQYDIAGNIGS